MLRPADDHAISFPELAQRIVEGGCRSADEDWPRVRAHVPLGLAADVGRLGDPPGQRALGRRAGGVSGRDLHAFGADHEGATFAADTPGTWGKPGT